VHPALFYIIYYFFEKSIEMVLLNGSIIEIGAVYVDKPFLPIIKIIKVEQ
jgi:hypothetical protein